MKLRYCRENREEENRRKACSLRSYVLRLVRLGLCVQMFGAGLSVKSGGVAAKVLFICVIKGQCHRPSKCVQGGTAARRRRFAPKG